MFTIELSNVDIIAVMYGPQKFIHWVVLVQNLIAAYNFIFIVNDITVCLDLYLNNNNSYYYFLIFFNFFFLLLLFFYILKH